VSPQSVQVQATNRDTAPHSFTIQLASLRGEELLGLATGVVNSLGPGMTATATLTPQGTITGQEELLLAVDTVF
jgi:hypothetical protein